MLKMIADHMENGFLENIIDMFKHDNSLYLLLGDLLGDERMRVRIGTVALVETLVEEKVEHLQSAIPAVAKLLKDSNATIRGDAAYVLGIIGHSNALPFLKEVSGDEHQMVRKTVIEAIEEIGNLD
jgi:hypothetical protein